MKVPSTNCPETVCEDPAGMAPSGLSDEYPISPRDTATWGSIRTYCGTGSTSKKGLGPGLGLGLGSDSVPGGVTGGTMDISLK